MKYTIYYDEDSNYKMVEGCAPEGYMIIFTACDYFWAKWLLDQLEANARKFE